MTTEGRANRIYQTNVPFVEMYINTRDVLRSRSGKPRSLVSFTHDIYVGTGGFWTIELFDPDYIAIEDFLVSTAVDSTVIGQQVFGDPVIRTDQETTNMSSAAFRYGYAGHSHQEVAAMPNKSYFYGSVHAYVPRYETNGTYLTIRGDSAGTRIRQVPLVYNNYTGMTILEIFESVCEQQNWTLELTGGLDAAGLADALKKEAPGRLGKVGDSAVHTEVEPPQQNKRENEDALSFLNRLCLYVRTVSREFNNISCRLEYRVTTPTASAAKATGVLYLSADTLKRGPIRTYTYMRDPTSDVISYSPNVQVWVAAVVGASGMVFKMEDARKGDTGVYTYDEVNREKKKFLEERELGSSNVSFTADTGVRQKGIDHTPGEDKPEGVGEKGRFAGSKAPDQDASLVEFTVQVNDEYDGDHQTLNYWLAMQKMVSRASLQIFGDPAEDLVPGAVVKVNVYVPTNEGGQDIHWLTNYWVIVGVNHEIRGGAMITNLELVRQGVERGGVESKAPAVEAKPKGGQSSLGV